jgi:hypothetical protein
MPSILLCPGMIDNTDKRIFPKSKLRVIASSLANPVKIINELLAGKILDYSEWENEILCSRLSTVLEATTYFAQPDTRNISITHISRMSASDLEKEYASYIELGREVIMDVRKFLQKQRDSLQLPEYKLQIQQAQEGLQNALQLFDEVIFGKTAGRSL